MGNSAKYSLFQPFPNMSQLNIKYFIQYNVAGAPHLKTKMQTHLTISTSKNCVKSNFHFRECSTHDSIINTSLACKIAIRHPQSTEVSTKQSVSFIMLLCVKDSGERDKKSQAGWLSWIVKCHISKIKTLQYKPDT